MYRHHRSERLTAQAIPFQVSTNADMGTSLPAAWCRRHAGAQLIEIPAGKGWNFDTILSNVQQVPVTRASEAP